MAHETWPILQGRLPFEPHGDLIDEWLFDDEEAQGGTSGTAAHSIAVPQQSASGQLAVTGQVTILIAVPSQVASGRGSITGAASQSVPIASQTASGLIAVFGASATTITVTGSGSGAGQTTGYGHWSGSPRYRRVSPRRRAWH